MWRLPFYLIRVYQGLISPLLPSTCRFTPTCSHYSAQAYREHGFLRGSRLTIHRILRCHPWHDGGHDPVPLRSSQTHPTPTGDLRHG